jgi:hypothetical protein
MRRRTFFRWAAGGAAAIWRSGSLRAADTRPVRSTDTRPSPATAPAPGTLTGRVVYDGEPPEPEILDCSADPQCAQLYRKNPLTSEALLVAPDGGLRNVFVSVERGLPEGKKWPIPRKPVVIDQIGCLYVPHIIGVMAGQPLKIINSSRINEVPHGLPKRNPEFSFNLPRKGMSQHVILTEPETFQIICDVHPWELAWCHVMAHPFFAVTDVTGRFVIRDLAPGTYSLRFWHEHASLGTRTREVTVTPDRPLELADEHFKPRRRPRPPR